MWFDHWLEEIGKETEGRKMGVDSGIFAKKSLKYFWFDRDYNLKGFTHVDDFYEQNEKQCEIAHNIVDLLYRTDKEGALVTSEELCFVAELSKKAWLTSKDDLDRVYYCEKIIEFCKLHPDDLFTVKTDHGDEWPECMDSYQKDTTPRLFNYEEWLKNKQ